jgi:hypothetical protein
MRYYYRADCYYALANKEKACERWQPQACALGDKDDVQVHREELLRHGRGEDPEETGARTPEDGDRILSEVRSSLFRVANGLGVSN